jgi:hypothetical protein
MVELGLCALIGLGALAVWLVVLWEERDHRLGRWDIPPEWLAEFEHESNDKKDSDGSA